MLSYREGAAEITLPRCLMPTAHKSSWGCKRVIYSCDVLVLLQCDESCCQQACQ